jgi:single-strand DNA-binding protein
MNFPLGLVENAPSASRSRRSRHSGSTQGMRMNLCVLSGHLVRDGVVKGTDKKVLLFTLAAKHGAEENGQKERVSHVPCVVFNPSPELEQALKKGAWVELEGRISTSSYEANGERRYVTEVVAFNRSLSVAQS